MACRATWALALASLGVPACGGGDALPGEHRDGGTDAACVPLGGVAFRMEAPPVDGGYCYQFSFGDPGDGVWWYSVDAPDGSALQIFLPQGARSSCNECDPKPYPIGQGCAPVPDGGVSGGWGGTTYTGVSTCEPPSTSSYPSPAGCATIGCLPPGRYTVKMCAERANYPSPVCVSIPFDFPTDAAVVGQLPP
jgi:hypothetical protein